MGRSWAYARLERLTEDGLLEQRALLYQRPGLYVATRAGLRWRGLGNLEVCSVRPGGFEHAWELAGVAVALERALVGWQVLSEREIRASERDESRPLASIQLGAPQGDRPRLHRPDLALVSPEGGVVAVEVELSVKARPRLLEICRGWARARHVECVYYIAAPAAARAVRRAIKATRAQEQVKVFALEQTQALAAAAQREAGHVDR
jgi:hypothetical protein